MPDGLTVAIAAIVAVSAPLAGWLAHRRERPPAAWFVLGALGGPFAIAVLVLAPPGACPRCDSDVAGWPAACATCGHAFRPVPVAPDRLATPAPSDASSAAPAPKTASPESRSGRRPRAVGPGRPASSRPTSGRTATLVERTMGTAGATSPSAAPRSTARASARRSRAADKPGTSDAAATLDAAATPDAAAARGAVPSDAAAIARNTSGPATAPDAPAPDATAPDASAPDAAAPGTIAPAVTRPQWAIPDVRELVGRRSGRADASEEGVQPDRAPANDETPTLVIVASGVFTGGSAALEIGSRYGIGREGHHLVVLGPVDRTPNEVRVTLPLDGIDVLSIDDRMTVATRSGRHDRLAMAFTRAAGLRGTALEEAIADVTAAATNGDRQ